MKLKAVALTLVLCAAACLAQLPVRDSIWGEFPSVVLVKTPDHPEFCLGTVLNANHVLTSASCVIHSDRTRVLPARLVRIIGGVINIRDVQLAPHGRQERNVEHIFVHENFRWHVMENDLAVLRLAAPFHLPSNSIEPVVMRTRIVANNSPCFLVSWDRQTLTADPRQLAYSVPIADRDVCAANQILGRTVREDVHCMRVTNPAATLDQLAEGDPLFCDGQLAAIYSFRWSTTENGVAVTYLAGTQVRFASHWIQNQLTRTQPMPVGWNPSEN